MLKSTSVIENLFLPILGRVGSWVTAFLIGVGAESGHADIVGLAVPSVIIIAGELTISWWNRRRVANRARGE